MTMNTHAPAKKQGIHKPGAADPMKQEASIQILIRFIDKDYNMKLYSKDVKFKGQYLYQNKQYWVNDWKRQIEFRWAGRVVEAAIFHNNMGEQGEKICQFTMGQGWDR